MAKSKQRKQKQKKKKSKKQNNNTMKRNHKRSTYISQAIANTCSNLDPFCPHAYGAKLHDENAAKSLTFQSRFMYTFDCDAQGNSMVMFSYAPQYGHTKATLTAGVVSSWGAWQVNTFNNSIGTTCSKWRVVSWGVHITSTAPFNTSQGVFITTEVTENVTGTTGQTIGSTSSGTDSQIQPAPGADMWFVGKPLGMEAQTYVQGISTASFNSYSSLLVALNGGPPSLAAAFVAEIVINYEWIPVTVGSGYNTMASMAAPHDPVVMSGRSNAAASLPVVFHGRSNVEVGHRIMDTVESVLDLGARAASMMGPMGRLASTAYTGARLMGSLLNPTTRKMIGN